MVFVLIQKLRFKFRLNDSSSAWYFAVSCLLAVLCSGINCDSSVQNTETAGEYSVKFPFQQTRKNDGKLFIHFLAKQNVETDQPSDVVNSTSFINDTQTTEGENDDLVLPLKEGGYSVESQPLLSDQENNDTDTHVKVETTEGNSSKVDSVDKSATTLEDIIDEDWAAVDRGFPNKDEYNSYKYEQNTIEDTGDYSLVNDTEYDQYPDYDYNRDFNDTDLSGKKYRDRNEFARRACVCGVVAKKRIVGGNKVGIIRYPWTAQLVINPIGFFFCGGSIINRRYILTAAHCVFGASPSRIGVRVGITSSSQSKPFVEVMAIKIHARYNNNDATIYDIALVKLKKDLTFSERIRPICLKRRDLHYFNQNGFIAGWGRIREGGPTPGSLKAAVVKMTRFDTCRKQSNYNPQQLHRKIVCASRKNTDTCQGDSGGPLMLFNKNFKYFTLVGITSYGRGCARENFPGVYTNVATYNDWIQARISDTARCTAPRN